MWNVSACFWYDLEKGFYNLLVYIRIIFIVFFLLLQMLQKLKSCEHMMRAPLREAEASKAPTAEASVASG